MVIEKEYAYILDTFFPNDVVAGFTKPILEGNPVNDTAKALSFRDEKFKVAYMQQIHGADVKVIDGPGMYTCDGSFTKSRGLALVVKTADCMPLIFHSEQEGIIGAVHMGWRSAKDGILDNIPYDLSLFRVAAGVGMRRCCYEVGGEFLEYANIRPYVVSQNDKYYFDALAFSKASLIAKGLKEENFLDMGICSYCSERGFFSNRKTATPNRTLTFIAISLNPSLRHAQKE